MTQTTLMNRGMVCAAVSKVLTDGILFHLMVSSTAATKTEVTVTLEKEHTVFQNDK